MSWINVKDELPPLEEPVWLLQGQQMWIGGRTDAPDGWLWANCDMTHWFDDTRGEWDGDMDVDDDYQPTHWMPLPEPLTANGEQDD